MQSVNTQTSRSASASPAAITMQVALPAEDFALADLFERTPDVTH